MENPNAGEKNNHSTQRISTESADENGENEVAALEWLFFRDIQYLSEF